jgi:hypothetical protein
MESNCAGQFLAVRVDIMSANSLPFVRLLIKFRARLQSRTALFSLHSAGKKSTTSTLSSVFPFNCPLPANVTVAFGRNGCENFECLARCLLQMHDLLEKLQRGLERILLLSPHQQFVCLGSSELLLAESVFFF